MNATKPEAANIGSPRGPELGEKITALRRGRLPQVGQGLSLLALVSGKTQMRLMGKLEPISKSICRHQATALDGTRSEYSSESLIWTRKVRSGPGSGHPTLARAVISALIAPRDLASSALPLRGRPPTCVGSRHGRYQWAARMPVRRPR